MTVQELMDILNNKKEIPNPKKAELYFYLTKNDGETVLLELSNMSAFDISTDIIANLVEEKR
jgi:hypothetical protein